MNTPLYIITQIGFIATTIIFFYLVIKHLKTALGKSSIPANKQRTLFKKVILALLAWTAILSGLSIAGIFSNFTSLPPPFVIIVLVPMITLVWSLLFSNTTKELLHHVAPQTIINLQVFRVVVEILLWMLFIQALLPIQMTFEGRNFDIIAGITAPIVTYMAYSKNLLSRKAIIIWNILCLALLLNIVIVAILSMPTPFRYFMNEPANTIIAQFPFVWLAGLLVPLAYGLHFLSIRQLLNQKN